MKSKIIKPNAHEAAQIYKDLQSLYTRMYSIITNITKDGKNTLGYPTLEILSSSISNFIITYNEHDKLQKLENVSVLINTFGYFKSNYQLMKRLGIITQKQYLGMFELVEKIQLSLCNWHNKIYENSILSKPIMEG